MRNIYLITLFFSFSFAVVTVAPDGTQDFTTIQAAIDYVTANPFDIEIDVYPGTYQENLLIEADMIIRSVGDANNTIIDGSLGRSLGSTIVIRPESMSTHHPLVEIDGFGITNGKGTDVVNNTITFPDGTHPTEKVGGGLFVYVSSPKINNSQFLDNGNNSTDKGGAVFASGDSDAIGFYDRDHYKINPELTPATDPLDFSNNTFLGNDAHQGHSVYILGYDNTTTDLTEGYFDVYSSEYESASEYWVKGEQTEFNFVDASGTEAIYVDVWVNPEIGIDEGYEIGDSLNPFLTINYALGMIWPADNNFISIHLQNGTYSPGTNDESFPIILDSFINLIGQGAETAILDAGQTGRVIKIEDCVNNILSKLTITGGFVEDGFGGGISIWDDSEVIFQNVSIENNVSLIGGGIGIFDGSIVTIINSTITENYASWSDVFGGGGMYIGYNAPAAYIVNSIFWNNFPEQILISQEEDDPPTILSVVYSDVDGGLDGVYNHEEGVPNIIYWEANMNSNPLFVNPDSSDYTLQEQSECIDAGISYYEFQDDNIIDIPDSEYYGQAPDMGAFEYEGNSIVGDINDDGLINILDVVALVNIVLNGWDYNTAGDLNSDGVNNILDVVFLVNIILNG